MKSSTRNLLRGAVGTALLLLGSIATYAQVPRFKGGNPLAASTKGHLAKFDSEGALVDSIVEDTGILVLVP